MLLQLACAAISNFDLNAQPTEQVVRTITFAERVAYQYAIEEVYWRHQIWPKENREPKPLLETTLSSRQIEEKVENYLRKSRLVAEQRRSPITANELQVEMERMASQTKEPEVLDKLFKALGNDALIVAECLARPILANRLVGDVNAHTGIKMPAESSALASDLYQLPEISSAVCADRWTPTTTMNAPAARGFHTAIWTGSKLIVWGGGTIIELNSGGAYDPVTDSWGATTPANAPDIRGLHTAVWTGTEMIVWGGGNSQSLLNSGSRYNPITDTWTATSLVNAPAARNYHTAVWTGSEMVVWGGRGCGGNCHLNDGARYNPKTDSWVATSASNAPLARDRHSAVWTGSEMIIWGGSDGTNALHTGGRYNPGTDSWTPTGITNVPLGRITTAAVWAGDEMIVWGGVDETFNVTNTGCRYDPNTDSWISTTLINAPSARNGHSGVWTGSEIIVWGGGDTTGAFNTGGRHDPRTDSWLPTTTTNAPSARGGQTGVWTGSEMILWGGGSGNGIFWNTGGRYCAQIAPTASPTLTATPPSVSPTPSSTPTATPIVAPTPTPTPTLEPTATPTPAIIPGKALNISTRLRVEPGNNVMIGGFIVQSGTGAKSSGPSATSIALRGLGPSLESSGITDVLADPTVELRDATGALLLHNDNWQDDSTQAAQLIALNLAPQNSSESAIVAPLQPGSYTALLAGRNDGRGVGLLEIYDTNPATGSRLANISTRGLVLTGDNVMIGGFILGDGNSVTSVALRGMGPSLSQSGLSNVLSDPTLELRDSNGALLISNDNWQDDSTSAAQLVAHGLAPQHSLESGIFTSLAPGAFTAILSGKNGATGIGLVEIYNLQ